MVQPGAGGPDKKRHASGDKKKKERPVPGDFTAYSSYKHRWRLPSVGPTAAEEVPEEKRPLLTSSGGGSGKRGYGSSLDDDSLGSSNSSSKGEKKKSHGISTLFRFATATDGLLIGVGTLASFVHGAGWPILSIVFGGMSDIFLRAEITDFGVPLDAQLASMGMNGSASSIFAPIGIPEFNNSVVQFAIQYSVVGLAMLLASYVQVACWVSACERQILQLRRSFFKATLRQEVSWFDKHQSGELTSRLNDDMERVREGIGDKFSLFIQNVAAFFSGFIIGFIYNWKMTLVMMSLTPLLAAAGAWMGKTLGNIQKQELEKYAVAGAVAEEVLGNMRTVLAFNGQKREIRRYDAALEDGKAMGLRKYLYVGTGLFCTFFTMFASYALAFWYGSTLILNDPTFDRGTVFTVFFAVMTGSTSLGNALPHFNNITSALGAAQALYDIIDSQPHIDPYSETGRRPPNMRGRIEFKDVEFTYPTRKNIKILDGVSFVAEPGQKIAFVGASGCGKSTMINLLLRYYDPEAGCVTIDDVPVDELNVRYLRNMIGVVSQEPILFDGTLEENIKLGRPGVSHERIIEVTKLANAHNFIQQLPLGLQTRVGERGVQMSGGQKQRIAIARALVRNPTILLLDEATSALDAESESVVQKALDEAQKGRTTISIAHRLSTVRDADQIFVIKEGKVLEQGTHKELIEAKGQFYAMVLAQQLDSAEPSLEEVEEEVDGTNPADKISTVGGESAVSVSRSSSSAALRLRNRTNSSAVRKASRADSVVSEAFSGLTETSEVLERSSEHRAVSRRDSTWVRRLEEEVEEEGAEKVSVLEILAMNRKAWGLIAMGGIGSLLMGCVMPAFALFYSQIFAVFSEEGEQLRQDAIFWSMMFLLLGFIQGTGFFIAIYFYGQSGENITKTVRLNGFANLLRHDIAYFDDDRHATGKICTRLATDAPNLRAAVGNRLASVMSAAFSLVAGVVIAFIFGWKLALVITFGMLPIIIGAGFVEFTLQWKNQNRDAQLLEEAGRTATEAIENVRTVQALTREMHFFEGYSRNLVHPFKEAMKQAHIYGLGFGFSQSVVFFMYAAAFRYGGYLITQGEMNALDVFRVFFAVNFTGMSIGQASAFLPDIAKARLSAALLFKMIRSQPQIDSMSETGIKPELEGTVVMKSLHFRYPTRPTVRVLQGISLTVKPGKTLALVGPSGCGKSTVVSLLERFYDTKRGRIYLDGYDIKTLNLKHIRNQIGIVSQEPVLFDCSIKDNILYGLEGRVSHSRMIDAAKLANIHEFVMSLPKGYETPVGEKGTQLSGGQKQRIAIARAMVRDPKILLLDEATSALDTESEKVVQEALDRAAAGRTCIVIAHRLSTVQNADTIAVIKDGRVHEKGTHAELLEKNGLYASLCKRQQLVE